MNIDIWPIKKKKVAVNNIQFQFKSFLFRCVSNIIIII